MIRKRMVKSVGILLITTLLLSSCKVAKPSTIQMLWLFPKSVVFLEEQVAEKIEKWNQQLQEKGKNYRIEVTARYIPVSEAEEADLKNYDLVYSSQWVPKLRLLQESFKELQTELKEGKLQTLYSSMAPTYWETRMQNGVIYNTVRGMPVAVHGLWVTTGGLERIGMQVPEELIGKPLAEWREFFADVYAANENKPFLRNPYSINTPNVPVLGDFLWEAHFQMVEPHMGIAYDEPEKGVQCIYESTYAKEMRALWSEFAEAGYVFESAESWKVQAEWEEQNKAMMEMQSRVIYQPEAVEDLTGSGYWQAYPLQDKIVATNGPSEVNSFLAIGKESTNAEAVYELLNDLATDQEMAAQFAKEENGLFAILTPAAQITLPTKGVETAVTMPEEVVQNLKSFYMDMESAPAVGFTFDSTPVEKQRQAVFDLCYQETPRGLYYTNPIISKGNGIYEWSKLEQYLDAFIQDLYEAGMEEMLEEANRQLAEYRQKTK